MSLGLQDCRFSFPLRAPRGAACTGLALCLMAFPAHADLLVNGSFEAPLVPLGLYTNFAAGSPQIVGWSILGTEAAVTDGNFGQSGIVFQAQDGNQWIDLAGLSSNDSLNGVSQTLATTAGATYELSFHVGSATDGVFFFPSTIDLSIDGGGRVPFANPATPTTGLNWQQFSVNFVAQGSTTSLTFYNGSTGDNFVSALDNVSVTAVPEPASGALLLLGLSAVTAMSRRRLPLQR